jgi:hypothetical protein
MFFDFEKMLDELMLVFTCYSQVPISSSIRLNIAVLRALMSKSINAGKRADKDKLIESVPPSHSISSDRQVMFAPPPLFDLPLCRPSLLPLPRHVLHTCHPEAFQHITNVGIQSHAVGIPVAFQCLRRLARIGASAALFGTGATWQLRDSGHAGSHHLHVPRKAGAGGHYSV